MKFLQRKIIGVILALLMIVSCEDDPRKKKQNQKVSLEKGGIIVNTKGIKINWTAYKTIEKKPVKGTFQTVNIKNVKPGTSVEEAFDDLKISIPVSSVFTNLEERDNKLRQFFFGVMKNTELLSGTLHMKKDKDCSLSLSMNDRTYDLPLRYEINKAEHKVIFRSTLVLNYWNAQEAVKSINKSCYDQHKGSDGVSKTWDDVDLEVHAHYIDRTEQK